MTQNQSIKTALESKSIYLLDMDGTLYHSNTVIDGAREFVKTISKSGKNFVYMTNNSSKNANEYLAKLRRLGFEAHKKNIFTSGNAAAIYIKQNMPAAKIYVLGTNALRNELDASGINTSDTEADCVLCGYDTELTYEKITKACEFIADGAAFLATNPDIVCPAENGRYLPDCATICNMIIQATKKEPFYIGKPRPEMPLSVLSLFKKTTDDAVIIGDRLYTDIKCGENAEITTVLVLSGESTVSDIEKYGIYPDFITKSVKDLI